MIGFEVLTGQSAAVQRLSSMVARGRVPHALIFSGPEGSGKMRATMLLAQMLMCLERKSDEAAACDRCAGCAKVKERMHADVHTLGVDSEERLLKIDPVREAMRTLQLRPMEGRAKMLIIDRAERLTMQSQNALLKTLEEPPGNAFLILTSARAWTILPTILSRCQRVVFVPIATDEIARVLVESRGLAAQEAQLLAAMAEGSLARGLALDPTVAIALRDRAAGLDLRLFPGRKAAVFDALAASNEIAEERAELAQLLDALLVWLHDQAVIAGGARDVGVASVDRLADLQGLVEERGLQMVLSRARSVLYAKRRLDLPYNLNPQMVAEQLCLALAGQVVTPPDPEA